METPMDRKFTNKVNNAQGKLFEKAIMNGCKYYEEKGIAKIEKIPEPFTVIKTNRAGRFNGCFTGYAQPDFQGTMSGGRAIVFEAKYTSKDRIEFKVLSAEQKKSLEIHSQMGALAGVCCKLEDMFYFIPHPAWTNLEETSKYRHLKPKDIEKYRVKYKGAVLFLDLFEPIEKEMTVIRN